MWKKTAENNTNIYKHVFQILPDTIRTVDDFKLKEEVETRDINLLENIKGYLVKHPLEFLELDELPIFDKGYVIPKSVFT